MAWIVRLLLPNQLLRPVMKPATRFLVGALAIPLFRLFVRRVARMQALDRELEKDLEQWFRASLLLLVATANMERLLFGWISEVSPLDLGDRHAWIAIGFRLLLAIGVIEAMPDQALFRIIHAGPPSLRLKRSEPWFGLKELWWPYGKGLLCQHLSQSSPVLAIMAAIFGGDPAIPGEYTHWVVGWVCYGVAIAQYLVIGLVTSREKALGVLAAFDRQVELRRQELVRDFELESEPSEASPAPEPASSAGFQGHQPVA